MFTNLTGKIETRLKTESKQICKVYNLMPIKCWQLDVCSINLNAFSNRNYIECD